MLWPAPCPTPTPTAVPGTSRSPPSAPMTRHRRHLSRPASARASAAPTRSRPGRSNARPCWPPTRTGRTGCFTLRPTPLGSAVSPTGPSRCWMRPAGTCPAPDLAVAIEQLRGHIATRRGPIAEAQQILLAAAERAAPIAPERAVVMLAEAVNASFYAGDAATMRRPPSGPRRSPRTAQTGRIAFFALIARGMALIFSGDGERGAPAIRAAVEVLEHSDELGDDPRLLAWAAMGPIWLREANIGRDACRPRAWPWRAAQSAVGVLPFVLTHVAIDQAATDRWAEAQAGFHEAIRPGQGNRSAHRPRLLAWPSSRGSRPGRASQSRAACTPIEALSLAREMGLGVCEVWAIAALGDLELGLGRSEAALAHFEELRAVLRSRGILDADPSPVAGTNRDLPAPRPRTRRPPSSRRIRDATRTPRPSPGRWPGQRDAAGCSPRRSVRSSLRDRAQPCTARRQTPSRPAARTSPTVPACGGSGSGFAPASSFAPRWTCSTTSAPIRGRRWRGPSSPRPARPHAGGT